MEAGRTQARSRRLDDIAEALPGRAADLSRLFLAHTSYGISRTEVGVLGALSTGPHRITELAESEALTQPAISRLVDRLQQRDWVVREGDPEDGRVVMVALTDAGHELYENMRVKYRALVHEEMAALPDSDVETLSRAIEVLDTIISGLQERALISRP